MQIKILLISFFLMGCACNESKQKKSNSTIPESKQEMAFDETKWKIKKGKDFPYRNRMLKDIMSNEKFGVLKKDQILELLGEPRPDRPDTNYLYYRITETSIGPMPLHTKTLVIKFKADNDIEWMKIHE